MLKILFDPFFGEWFIKDTRIWYKTKEIGCKSLDDARQKLLELLKLKEKI